MKLSGQLKQDHECGDFGRALEGYSERAEKLEGALESTINELENWWKDQGEYGTDNYEKWIPELKAILND